jgi:RNA polymerase sigma-70 factor (ECF subfamily)
VASGTPAPHVPEAALLGAERREELVAALNRLGEADRDALACRFFLDLSEAGTAAALGVRPGTRQVAALTGARTHASRTGGCKRRRRSRRAAAKTWEGE